MNRRVILNGTEGYPVICQVNGFEIVAVGKVFQTPEGQRETAILYAEENVDIRRYESGISFQSLLSWDKVKSFETILSWNFRNSGSSSKT